QRLPLETRPAKPVPQDQAQRRGLQLIIRLGGLKPLEHFFQRRLSFLCPCGGVRGRKRQEGQRGARVGRRKNRPRFVNALPPAVLALIVDDRRELFLVRSPCQSG